MNLITDIRTIKRLSGKKEKENWAFRSFLKFCEIPSARIDQITHELYKEVSARIDCKQCANCCRELATIISGKDISRCAKHLGISKDDFIATYTKPSGEEKNSLELAPLPCPFLNGSVCSIYDVRPDECASYPHLHKKEFTTRLMSVIGNCSVCPIVFNVYELLKDRVKEMQDDLDFDDIY